MPLGYATTELGPDNREKKESASELHFLLVRGPGNREARSELESIAGASIYGSFLRVRYSHITYFDRNHITLPRRAVTPFLLIPLPNPLPDGNSLSPYIRFKSIS